ncbi:hypothetical protein IMX12_13165 [Streptomyces sp. Babs14]|uniref:hypothetical protein n=1 Tax=unclassified Streptomyces TaxID=2593676 RepID=UPI001C2182F2|nr:MULTISPECIES: hypothetical protein [unclassified Streptomyces]MBU8549759.1 hypothetical protein [Streptomyces sp. Osf17]MBU8556542.1 hypothetical protein [Streptomyces sp. Babs14]
MSIRTLPHDPYIEAVTETLTAAGLEPEQVDVRDDETRGVHLYLDAVITLTPEASGIDPDEWDDGLILVWEWHTGLDEDERGPSWQWAQLNEDGSNWPLQPMAVYGYASPAAVVTVVRQTLANPRVDHEPDLGVWEHANDLDTACEDWARE